MPARQEPDVFRKCSRNGGIVRGQDAPGNEKPAESEPHTNPGPTQVPYRPRENPLWRCPVFLRHTVGIPACFFYSRDYSAFNKVRPDGAQLSDPGMPSSHAMVSGSLRRDFTHGSCDGLRSP